MNSLLSFFGVDWQTLIALSIVFAALVLFLKKTLGIFVGQRKSGCGSGCGSCPANQNSADSMAVKVVPLVKLHAEPRAK